MKFNFKSINVILPILFILNGTGAYADDNDHETKAAEAFIEQRNEECRKIAPEVTSDNKTIDYHKVLSYLNKFTIDNKDNPTTVNLAGSFEGRSLDYFLEICFIKGAPPIANVTK